MIFCLGVIIVFSSGKSLPLGLFLVVVPPDLYFLIGSKGCLIEGYCCGDFAGFLELMLFDRYRW
jgi:hypothetical protein